MVARQDLYWKWAEATGYANYGPVPPNWYVPLLIECAEGKCPIDLHNWLQPANGRKKGFVPELYRTNQRRFCSAWVERKSIAKLPADTVRRFQLGLPQISSKPAHLLELQNKTRPDGWTEELLPRACKVLLAVIDDDININHSTFRDNAGQSRFKIFWDQNTNIARGSVPPRLGYTLRSRNPREKAHLQRASHGTHVASLAGGIETPQHRLRHGSSDILNPNAVDHASTTTLAGIILPNRTVQDTSGKALAVNVFDALSYLAANTPKKTHIVANLSFGFMAGPHNGSSLLDAALDEIIALREGELTVVVPAGSSFEMQCHAQIDIGANQREELVWRTLPDDRTPSFVEIWIPTGSASQITLRSPDGNCALLSAIRQDSQVARVQSVPCAAIFRSDKPANGDNGQLALLAVGPTRAESGKPVAPHGDWKIIIENPDHHAITARVWIERDNASFGQKPLGKQSYLVDPLAPRRPQRPYYANRATHITGYGSMNGIACGTQTVVVGGYNLRTQKPIEVSAAGSTDGFVDCPDGMAPSEESPLLKGLPGAAHAGGGVVRIGGTSVAAPLVSRFFVNALHSGLTIARPTPGRKTPGTNYDEIEGAGRLTL